jgi:hypothetical protein
MIHTVRARTARIRSTGTYSQTSDTVTKSGTFTSSTKDRPGVLVSGGELTLNSATLTPA